MCARTICTCFHGHAQLTMAFFLPFNPSHGYRGLPTHSNLPIPHVNGPLANCAAPSVPVPQGPPASGRLPRGELGWAAMTKTGPNDASDVIWSFFFASSYTNYSF